MHFNFNNPADDTITRINRDLDALTADLQAALAQRDTPVGEKSGIEQASTLLKAAEQQVGKKAEAGETKRLLERFTQTVIDESTATRREQQFALLAQRARDLSREATSAYDIARSTRSNANSRLNEGLNDLRKRGIAQAWIDNIREQVTAYFTADIVERVKTKIGA